MVFKNAIQQEMDKAKEFFEQQADIDAKRYPRFQRRKKRVFTVAPTAEFTESGVMGEPGGAWIFGPTEVDANDMWIWRRIQQNELEIVGEERLVDIAEFIKNREAQAAKNAEQQSGQQPAEAAQQPAPTPAPQPTPEPQPEPQPAE